MNFEQCGNYRWFKQIFNNFFWWYDIVGVKFWLWPKILDTTGSLQWQTAGELYIPYQENDSTTSGWRGEATNLKRTNPRSNLRHHFSTLWLARTARISPLDCPSYLSHWLVAGTRVPSGTHSGASHKRISITNPKTSGSGGLKNLTQRDVAAWAHAHLTICTRVLDPSHCHLTQQQDQEYTPKHHDDSAMG
jgi:hypothetical protein